MPKELNLEFKVGLFMLAAMIGLAVFIFSVSDSAVLKKEKIVRVVFGFANGLKKSAPVRIAGVDEGLVKDIRLFFDRTDSKTKVEVEEVYEDMSSAKILPGKLKGDIREDDVVKVF